MARRFLWQRLLCCSLDIFRNAVLVSTLTFARKISCKAQDKGPQQQLYLMAALRMNSNSTLGDYRRTSFSDDAPLAEVPTSSIWRLLIQEARAVSLWSCLSTLLRLCFVLLSLIARYQYGQEEDSHPTITNAITEISSLQQPISAVTHKRLLVASGLAGLLLYSAPWKVVTLQAPGFSFANPWYVSQLI